ncbi:ABC transporter substrate-binding protein [Butyrivibrio sp.]|uniref:ABC transporter substrate-binding protein n=1 Tax=Butyrivibrio sp. TaxID=28121 RepID=UPI0025F2DCDD|nr:ABC transporter substrate-binding protein [Butyrivibrio sp.]
MARFMHKGLGRIVSAFSIINILLVFMCGCSDSGSSLFQDRGLFNNDAEDESDSFDSSFNDVAESESLSEDGIYINSGDTITVGFSQIGAESDWRLACTNSVVSAFTIENGYNLIYDDAQQKQENQFKAIREFIDQDVDYIILDPIVETGWEGALLEAKEAGIPVIIVDRRVNVEDDSLYTAWVGADFYLEGARACAWLDAFLDKKGIDKEIGIIDIQGTIGASAQIGRSTALLDAVEAHDNWTLLAAESGDFVKAKGREVMEKMIKEYGYKIDVVYCENDNEAYGAIEALKEAGYRIGTDIANGDVLVISFDSTREGLELTLDGTIAVDTECNPLYGPILTQTIGCLENNTNFQKESYVLESQFSADRTVYSTRIDGNTYKVTILSQEIIDERVY